MTALRWTSPGFGYPPAREARLVSERAFERAVATSCALVAALFALALLLRGLLPSAPSGAQPARGPLDIGGFVMKTWQPAGGPAAPRVHPGPGVPLPVPDPEPSAMADPPPAGPVAGGVADHDLTIVGPGGGTGSGVEDPAMPEPGVWVPVQQLPDVVLRVAPLYPDFAREAQVEGTVQLWALVDLDGSVREVRVRRSVPLLDEAAVAAVARWRFTPALDNGRPVRVWVAIPVRFTLR